MNRREFLQGGAVRRCNGPQDGGCVNSDNVWQSNADTEQGRQETQQSLDKARGNAQAAQHEADRMRIEATPDTNYQPLTQNGSSGGDCLEGLLVNAGSIMLPFGLLMAVQLRHTGSIFKSPK